jgi:hypothetical protein
MNFGDAVNAVQKGISQASIEINIGTKSILCSGQTIKFAPLELAFYLWIAVRRKQNKAALWWNFEDIRADFAREYLKYYAQVLNKGEQAAHYQNKKKIFDQQKGMDRNGFFAQTLSKVNKKLDQVLGQTLAEKYHILSKNHSGTQYKVYEIDLHKDNIYIPTHLLDNQH